MKASTPTPPRRTSINATRHFVGSQWSLREVERAASKQIPIIAFRIDDVSPTKAMEYFLGIAQWFDAFDPPLDDHLQELAAAMVFRHFLIGFQAYISHAKW